MTVYTSASRQPVAQLRATVNTHAVDASTGRCVACHVEAPCPTRAGALRALAARGELPSRAAGATRPELIGARRINPPKAAQFGPPTLAALWAERYPPDTLTEHHSRLQSTGG